MTDINNTESSTNCFVAFCDILGFSASIENDFDATLNIYREFCEFIDPVLARDGVQITVYSDAILIAGQNLHDVAQTIQILCCIALQHGMLIRGGISYGRYWEKKAGRHLFVVSEALVRSVRLESSIKVPAVVLGDEVEVPDELWLVRFKHNQFTAPVLWFDQKRIVNPLSMFWGKSAGIRASILMEESSPEHRSKYEWFLQLHQEIMDGHHLIPDEIIDKYVELGVLRFTGDQAEDENALGRTE